MPNKRLFLSLILKIIILNAYVECDCGRPHRPAFGSHNKKNSQRLKEDSTVNYNCDQSYRLIYDEQTVCKYGVWSGRPAVCVKPITSDVTLKKLVIFSDEIKVYNISGSYNDFYNIWKSSDNQKCLSSDSFTQQNWTLILSKPEVINYFVIKLKDNSFENDSIVTENVKSIIINSKQIKLKRHPKTCSLLKFNTNNELEFICNSFSKLNTETEENDKSDEILINFNSNFSKLLSICGLGIYHFPEDCGKTGLSLEMNAEGVNEEIELEASCSDGYELIGSSRIVCSSNGQWIGSSSCKPLITCPLIEPNNKFDEKVLRIEYRNGFYFNKTFMAVNETDAIHYCFKNNITNNNKSFTRQVVKYTRVCENGVWTEADTDCDTLLIDDSSIDNPLTNASNYYSIIITMIVMIIMFSVLSISSYSILRFKNRRKLNQNIINSSDIKNKLTQNSRNITKYTNNRLSDPFDDSVYSMVAEENYDIINFDAINQNLSQNYDDTEVPKPLYLEILPINEVSSASSSLQNYF